MKRPKCRNCPHSRNDGWTKRCTKRFGGVIKLTKDKYRPDWCPLLKQEAELSYREAKAITHTATKLDDATCPSCGNVVGEKQIWEGRKIFIQWKYCIFCGQKLDWESR